MEVPCPWLMESQNLAYLRHSPYVKPRLYGGLSKIWEERRRHLVAGLYGAKGLLSTQAARTDAFRLAFRALNSREAQQQDFETFLELPGDLFSHLRPCFLCIFTGFRR